MHVDEEMMVHQCSQFGVPLRIALFHLPDTKSAIIDVEFQDEAQAKKAIETVSGWTGWTARTSCMRLADCMWFGAPAPQRPTPTSSDDGHEMPPVLSLSLSESSSETALVPDPEPDPEVVAAPTPNATLTPGTSWRHRIKCTSPRLIVQRPGPDTTTKTTPRADSPDAARSPDAGDRKRPSPSLRAFTPESPGSMGRRTRSPRVLLVYGLHDTWREGNLRALFGVYGDVINVKRLHRTGGAMVEMETKEQAERAMACLDGQTVSESKWSVRPADADKIKDGEPKRPTRRYLRVLEASEHATPLPPSRVLELLVSSRSKPAEVVDWIQRQPWAGPGSAPAIDSWTSKDPRTMSDPRFLTLTMHSTAQAIDTLMHVADAYMPQTSFKIMAAFGKEPEPKALP